MIKGIDGQFPIIGQGAFVAEEATVIGRVIIKDMCSVWYGAVVKGDIASITIGDKSNIQDNCVVHGSLGKNTVVGKGVTVGHGAILHACTIGDHCIIGMGSIIMDGSEIGSNTIIGAGSLIPKNVKIPSGVMAYGSPAKIIRPLTEEEQQEIRQSAERNYKNAMINHLNVTTNLEKK